MPPHWARATASSGDDTACMMALVSGTAMRTADSSPTRWRTTGALKSTFSGTQSSVVRLGSSRYSFRVLDVSSAIRMPLLELLCWAGFRAILPVALWVPGSAAARPRFGSRRAPDRSMVGNRLDEGLDRDRHRSVILSSPFRHQPRTPARCLASSSLIPLVARPPGGDRRLHAARHRLGRLPRRNRDRSTGCRPTRAAHWPSSLLLLVDHTTVDARSRTFDDSVARRGRLRRRREVPQPGRLAGQPLPGRRHHHQQPRSREHAVERPGTGSPA